MDKAGEIATKAIAARGQSTGSSSEPASAPSRPPLPVQAMELIGATMTAAFHHRWTSIHGDDFAETSGTVWAVELAGLGQRAIERGLREAVRQPWPPSLGEFKGMCLGVLSLEEVIRQRAGKAVDQHPFTVLVGRKLPEHDWRMADPRERSRLIAEAYRQACAHLLAGGKMPSYTPASQQLTAQDINRGPPPIRLTPEEAMRRIRETLRVRDEPDTPPPPPPRPPLPEPCKRCAGSRREPSEPGECLACYGSGIEAAYNRVIHPNGTIEERMP